MVRIVNAYLNKLKYPFASCPRSCNDSSRMGIGWHGKGVAIWEVDGIILRGEVDTLLGDVVTPCWDPSYSRKREGATFLTDSLISQDTSSSGPLWLKSSENVGVWSPEDVRTGVETFNEIPATVGDSLAMVAWLSEVRVDERGGCMIWHTSSACTDTIRPRHVRQATRRFGSKKHLPQLHY